MNEKLFQMILAFIPMLGTFLAVYMVPLLKEKIDREKLKKYRELASIAVKAAEMLWTKSGSGESKKIFVINYLNKLFNSKKTLLTAEQLNILIEAAVKEMNDLSKSVSKQGE